MKCTWICMIISGFNICTGIDRAGVTLYMDSISAWHIDKHRMEEQKK